MTQGRPPAEQAGPAGRSSTRTSSGSAAAATPRGRSGSGAPVGPPVGPALSNLSLAPGKPRARGRSNRPAAPRARSPAPALLPPPGGPSTSREWIPGRVVEQQRHVSRVGRGEHELCLETRRDRAGPAGAPRREAPPGDRATQPVVKTGIRSADDLHRTGDRTAQRVEHERRSEEHTSELQSPCNLVCRLLLEKKKQTV